VALKRGSFARRLSDRFRAKRDIRLRAQIDHLATSGAPIHIADLGGTEEYWNRVGFEFLRERRVRITLINLHASELNVESLASDILTSEVGDACALVKHADMSFDLVHSNSVIEHVLTWENMKSLSREIRRLAPAYYVQTPYFWFPIDPHYYKFPLFHWLPPSIRARLFTALPIAHSGRIADIGESYAAVDAARLLDKRQFVFLFPDSKVSFERLFGLPKSLIAIKS
jgi:hypothetical protein